MVSDADRTASSMWLHRSLGTKLVSAEIAVQIARLVTKERYGKIEVDRNEPFTAIADGDTWIVKGSVSQEFNDRHPPMPAWHGPVRARISQYDGQILDYLFDINASNAGESNT